MTPEYLEKQLRRLEKLVRRLECLVCPPDPCTAIVNWEYSGEDLGDEPVFIITVNGVEVVNATSCVFPACPDPQSGSFTVTEGDEVVLVIGNSGGFHIFSYNIQGSVDGEIATGGDISGQDTVPFTVTCQTYTITGNQ